MNFKISTDSVKAIKQYVSYVESKNGDITRHHTAAAARSSCASTASAER